MSDRRSFGALRALVAWASRTAVARGLRWAPALLVLFSTLFAASEAQAAVPMCSSDGRTVIAPPIMVAGRGLVLEAPPPCPTQPESSLVKSVPTDPNAPAPPSVETPLRVLPVWASQVPPPYAGRRALETERTRPGSDRGSSIFRPPRA